MTRRVGALWPVLGILLGLALCAPALHFLRESQASIDPSSNEINAAFAFLYGAPGLAALAVFGAMLTLRLTSAKGARAAAIIATFMLPALVAVVFLLYA